MSGQRQTDCDSPTLQRTPGVGTFFFPTALERILPATAMVTPEQPTKEVSMALSSKLIGESCSLVVPGDMLSRPTTQQATSLVPRAATAEPTDPSRLAQPTQNPASVPEPTPFGPTASPGDHNAVPFKPHQPARLNKFVRRLHDMLKGEQKSGIVEWRRGLLVLHSTDAFAQTVLPKYFRTRNFKTFRRQLNYYGFVHVRSFSTTGSATTALWVNRNLAQTGTDDISSVLMLRRVDPGETTKTAEGRRQRKEEAIHTVEEDIGVSPKSLQLEQIRSMAVKGQTLLLAKAHGIHTDAPLVAFAGCSDQSGPTGHSDNPSTSFSAARRMPRKVSEAGVDDLPCDGESAIAASVLLMLSRA